jgi:DNA excision repair protein ERCC-2
LFSSLLNLSSAPALLQRLDFMRSNYGVSPSDYLTFDAVRHAAQCAGRVIRSKSDYAVTVFADSRFALPGKRDKLPAWLRQDLLADHIGLDTDSAALLVRRFVREMAQPWDLASKLGTELWGPEHIPNQPRPF